MKSKPLLILVASLATRVALGQAEGTVPDTTVTYTTVAVPLARAFGEIGKGVGVKFEIDDSMAQEPVILRLDGVALKEVMDRVASMEEAEWKGVRGGFRLFRSSDDVARLAAADGERRAAAIKKSIDDRVARSDKEGRMTAAKAEEMAQMQVLLAKQAAAGVSPLENGAARSAQAHASPGARLFAQIMASFSAADLGSLRPGGRYVYTANPTAVQYPLPEIDPGVLREFFDDTNLLNDTINADFEKAAGIPESMKPNAPHMALPPSRVRLVVEPWVGGDQVHLTLTLLDVNGETLSRLTDTIAWNWDAMADRQKEAQLQRIAVTKGILLSKDTADMAKTLRQGSSSPSAPVLDPSLTARLALPTEHDPNSFACSEIVLGLAELNHANAVFLPTDGNEEFSLFGCRSGSITWDLFKFEMDREANTSVDLKDGWLVGGPISPLRSALYRWPRPALEKFDQSLLANGGASIDELGDLMMTMPHGSGEDQINFYKTLLLPPQPGISGIESEEALRLWASLSDEQKAAAGKGGITLMRDQMDPDQRSLATDFLYLGASMIWLEDSAVKGLSDFKLDSMYEAAGTSEKTETFPNGIPAGATLEVKDVNTPSCFYSTTDDRGHVQEAAQPLDEIAASYAQSLRPDLFPVAAKMAWQNFKVGSQRKVTIKLHLDGHYVVTQEIDESQISNSSGVPFDKVRSILSGDAQKKFDADVARFLELYKNHKPGDFGPVDSGAPGTPPVQAAPPPSL